MLNFTMLVYFKDGTSTTINITAPNYRVAMNNAMAFIPAWSTRVVKALNIEHHA